MSNPLPPACMIPEEYLPQNLSHRQLAGPPEITWPDRLPLQEWVQTPVTEHEDPGKDKQASVRSS